MSANLSGVHVEASELLHFVASCVTEVYVYLRCVLCLAPTAQSWFYVVRYRFQFGFDAICQAYTALSALHEFCW